jgi:hypothetical protein
MAASFEHGDYTIGYAAMRQPGEEIMSSGA